MILKYKSQILNTIFADKIIVTNRQLNVARVKHLEDEVAKILALAKFNNITLKNSGVLWDLNEDTLEDIQQQLGNLQGVTLFDMSKEYGLEEAFKTIAQYLRDYGNFDIPESLWLNLDAIEKIPGEPRTIEFVGPDVYETELARIFTSAKNPDSFDNLVLYNLCNVESVECGYIINKDVLNIALRNTLVFFSPINTAQIRIYASAYPKLKTSQKTWIMRNLNKFPIADILDDFATHKSEWKRIESKIIPTQKRYASYGTANRAFHFLRNSEFCFSNNSQVQKLLEASEGSSEKFQKLCELKSPQFAIRNFTRLYNPKESEDLFKVIAETDIKLKQLVELYNALSLNGSTRTARIKGKFWTRKVLNISYGSALEKLKDIIGSKIKALAHNFAEDLMVNADLQAKFASAGPKLISVENLKHYALPINTDKFMVCDSAPLLTRGSKLPINLNKIGVFVSWKRKDGSAWKQDIDLSANIVESGFAKSPLDGLPTIRVVNFTHLHDDTKGIKHSGDFTSCMGFNPETGYITTEMITADLSKCKDLDLHFMINTFNGVSLKDFDVYVGICGADMLSKCKKGQGHSTFRLADASMIFKIAGDIAGYYKLFTITDNCLLMEGTEINALMGFSSQRSALSAAQAQIYTESLRGYSVYDFVKAQYPDKTEVNEDKLKLFLDYAVNKA